MELNRHGLLGSRHYIGFLVNLLTRFLDSSCICTSASIKRSLHMWMSMDTHEATCS